MNRLNILYTHIEKLTNKKHQMKGWKQNEIQVTWIKDKHTHTHENYK